MAHEFSERLCAAAAAGSDPNGAWLFAHALLGSDASPSPGTEAEAAAAREHLEWLTRISPRHEESLRGIARADAAARVARDHAEFAARILGVPVAEWDASKHPRGGFPENPGWFSQLAGGPGDASDGKGDAKPKPADSSDAKPAPAASKDDILKALGGGPAAPQESPPLTSVFTWHSGSHEVKATLLKIDGDNVILQRDDSKNKVTVPIKKLSDDDQKLVDALKQKPPNIVVDGSSLPAADREKWERQVILSIGQLAATKNGKEILDDIKEVFSPPPQILKGQTLPSAPLNSKPITIVPRQSGGNITKYTEKNRGSADVRIFFDPTDTKGDLTSTGNRQRPPFVGLAKELHIAYNALQGAYRTTLQAEAKSREFENKLRAEIGLQPAKNVDGH